MKIAFLINSLGDGGAEKILVDLVDSLYEEGTDIELICIEKNNVYQINPNIRVTYLSNVSLKGNKIKSLLMTFVFAFRLKKYVKRNKIKLIQSHLFRANYVNLVAKVLFRSSHIAQVVNHSIISRLKNEGLAGKVNFFLIKYLYPFSDTIISVSNVVMQDMQKLFSFKCENIVIYNPFDIPKIQQLSTENVDDFVFDLGKKYIISVGRLIKIKRNLDLIYALQDLDKSVEVLFIGNGPEKESLESLAMELSVSSQVHFLGWVNNPYKYIKQADLLVSTSASESFGNTIVEAFICETPVVSSSCGGPTEVISKNCGLLFPIGDVSLLISSIKRVLFDSHLNNDLLKQASLRSISFSLPTILKKHKEILKNSK